MISKKEIDCQKLRMDLISIAYKGKSNHLGPNLSIVELMYSIWDNFLDINPDNFQNKNRDYFILSKGHASLIYYLILCEKGFLKKDFLRESWHKNENIFCEHPLSSIPGVDISTGSLGHGPSISVGLATGLPDSKVVAILGDGELNEGSVWEAAYLAAREQLGNLLWIIDANSLQGLGKTQDVSFNNFKEKFLSFGLETKEVDGHNLEGISSYLKSVNFKGQKPHVLIAHTIKGKGISFMENEFSWHYKSLNEEQYKACMQEIEIK